MVLPLCVGGVDFDDVVGYVYTYAHEGGENDESIDSLSVHDAVLSMMKLPLLR
jgi:hypothetical protein